MDCAPKRFHIAKKRLFEMAQSDISPIDEPDWPHLSTCGDCLDRLIQIARELASRDDQPN